MRSDDEQYRWTRLEGALADIDNFVALSAALTGIDAGKLAPKVDPLNVKQEYFDLLQKKSPDLFVRALGIAANNAPANIADLIINQSGDELRFFARSIMLLWLLGSWVSPADLQRQATGRANESPVPSVVSATAYTNGWIWNFAQAHPMGYSNLRFGHWNAPPPPLNDFIRV